MSTQQLSLALVPDCGGDAPHARSAGEIPRGFVVAKLPGAIAPTFGSHEGVSMFDGSACCQALIRAREDRLP